MGQIWQPFLEAKDEPLIVYSNALFLMSDEGDLYRYFLNGVHALPFGARVQSLAGLERRLPAPPRKGPLSYSDAYTGTGEVVGAAKLAELFARAGRNFSVKRNGIVSFEDIRDTNVVFLGRPSKILFLPSFRWRTTLDLKRVPSRHLREVKSSVTVIRPPATPQHTHCSATPRRRPF